jgi:hypothetical protein
MRRRVVAIVVVSAILGCSSEPQRQWMKPGQPYTTADFSRDVAACSRAGVLDEACLKGRGWEPVTAGPTPDIRPPEPIRPTPAEPTRAPGTRR